ncbi:MAG: hypothetical protein C3F11_03435 [Methylocystaceae bacterium]|nr:MAG: hypothetical protein C3F11_03435 [Methylocystaceae bacterium]
MKRATFLFMAAAVALWSAAPAVAQQSSGARSAGVAIPANLAALLQSNPNGGDELSSAIADLLTNDPAAAPSVVALAKRGNPDQKAAIAVGVLRALTLLRATNPEGARVIRAALRDADPVFRAILAALEARLYAETGQGFGRGDTLFFAGGGGFSSGGGGGSGRNPFVSPN